MKKLVIVGCGGFAKEVAFLVTRINQKVPTWNFLGFIDQNGNAEHVIGNDEWLMGQKKELDVAIAIGSPEIRKRLYSLYRYNSFLSYPNIIDPSVVVSDSVSMGVGNIICANTILTVEIKIGNFNIFNLNTTIGHGSRIEDYITINPGVNISGDVEVHSLSDVGTGVQIIQGKKIGENTRIGAGAVVISDLPGQCTAVGIPAKVIK